MKVTRFLRLGGVSLDSLKFLPERSSACALSSPSQRSLATLAAKQVEATQLSRGDSLFSGLLKKTSISNPTPGPKHFSNSSLVRGIVSRQHQKSKQCLWHPQWPSSWNAGLFYSTKLNKMANVSAILKNQSALEVTKPARKKAPRISELGKTAQMDNVVAYALAEGVNLEGLEGHLINQGLYTIGQMPQDVTNALHVRGKYNVDQKPKEIFVFRDGSIVFWCVPEIERGAFMKMTSKYSVAPYVTSLVIYEREELDIKFTNGKSGLVGEAIHLRQPAESRMSQAKRGERGRGHSSDDEMESLRRIEREEEFHRLLEMYTFSNALSQSVKLAIWEASLSKFVISIISVTEDLRHGNKIRMSRKQVLMKTGELFSLRHLINLSSDLLDTPDFYWDRGTLEPLYKSLFNHLNIARRTRVMNEKLSHCCELTELLSTQLNDAHHTRLEVMIIVLIMVEVVFECIHYAERYLKSEGPDDSMRVASSTDT